MHLLLPLMNVSTSSVFPGKNENRSALAIHLKKDEKVHMGSSGEKLFSDTNSFVLPSSTLKVV